MLQRFVNWLALTRNEQRVIVFLTATLIIGTGIRLYQDSYPKGKEFDYGSIDSAFAAAQVQLRSDTTNSLPDESDRGLNINRATKAELLNLPGIGETLADRIIRLREELGEFEAVTDLQKVKGISQKKFEKLKPLVTVQ